MQGTEANIPFFEISFSSKSIVMPTKIYINRSLLRACTKDTMTNWTLSFIFIKKNPLDYGLNFFFVFLYLIFLFIFLLNSNQTLWGYASVWSRNWFRFGFIGVCQDHKCNRKEEAHQSSVTASPALACNIVRYWKWHFFFFFLQNNLNSEIS